MRSNWFIVLLLTPLAISCLKVEPIEVKPIHIVMDVNIRVDRELDQFFAFENTPVSAPATQSTTQPGMQS